VPHFFCTQHNQSRMRRDAIKKISYRVFIDCFYFLTPMFTLIWWNDENSVSTLQLAHLISIYIFAVCSFEHYLALWAQHLMNKPWRWWWVINCEPFAKLSVFERISTTYEEECISRWKMSRRCGLPWSWSWSVNWQNSTFSDFGTIISIHLSR